MVATEVASRAEAVRALAVAVEDAPVAATVAKGLGAGERAGRALVVVTAEGAADVKAGLMVVDLASDPVGGWTVAHMVEAVLAALKVQEMAARRAANKTAAGAVEREERVVKDSGEVAMALEEAVGGKLEVSMVVVSTAAEGSVEVEMAAEEQ
eukprot:2339190-Prymnesium_polylepis.1